jgi:hypothetical protein
MQNPLRADLSSFAHAHRVRFEVQPEVTFDGTDRLSVGYRISLWALHEKGARAIPGCPKCISLVEGLRQIAAEAVPREARPTRVSMEPFEPALYDSIEVPGADEVRLDVRLTHRDRYDAPIDACEDRCLREIRGRLKDLGVRER